MYNCLEEITAVICRTLCIIEVKARIYPEACSLRSVLAQIPWSQVWGPCSSPLWTELHDFEFVQSQSLDFPWDGSQNHLGWKGPPRSPSPASNRSCHTSSLPYRLPTLQCLVSLHRCSGVASEVLWPFSTSFLVQLRSAGCPAFGVRCRRYSSHAQIAAAPVRPWLVFKKNSAVDIFSH